MFCKNCGKELREGSKFCEYCGARIDGLGKTDDKAVYEQTFTSEDNAGMMRQIIGKNADQYMTRFEKIQNGEKSKMNWASFFLSVFHAGYRNVWREWLKAVRIPLVLELVSVLLAGILLSVQPIAGFGLLIAAGVFSIWFLVKQILFAKQFNRIYMEHVEKKIAQNDRKPDPSAGRAAIAVLIFLIIYMILSSVLSAGLVGAMFAGLDGPSEETDDLLSEDGWDDFAEEPGMGNSPAVSYEEDDFIPDEIEMESPDAEEIPQYAEETDVVWEGTWQRKLGPAASITIWTADESGLSFAASVGASGYASYIDMRDCTAGWIVEGQSAYYEDVSSGYDLEFSYENGVLIVNESVANASGLNLSGAYVPETEADYPSCEYVFADSDAYEIYEEDCEGLTALECRIAKNEIYARHGRRFNDESLQDYFDSCSWYEGYIEPEDFTEDMLSDVERANLQVIGSYEAYMGF